MASLPLAGHLPRHRAHAQARAAALRLLRLHVRLPGREGKGFLFPGNGGLLGRRKDVVVHQCLCRTSTRNRADDGQPQRHQCLPASLCPHLRPQGAMYASPLQGRFRLHGCASICNCCICSSCLHYRVRCTPPAPTRTASPRLCTGPTRAGPPTQTGPLPCPVSCQSHRSAESIIC